jgi:hypothetical protein
MTISDYQVTSVIKTYMKTMKGRMRPVERLPDGEAREDKVNISEEGMKRLLFERIGENTTDRLRRHDQE